MGLGLDGFETTPERDERRLMLRKAAIRRTPEQRSAIVRRGEPAAASERGADMFID